MNAATDAVRCLLTSIGENPDRDGLADTPRRVVAALCEMTDGYSLNPGDLLATRFTQTYDEMIVLTGVAFTSLCEHHLLPFTGTASVGYIPDGHVVGISKLARVVQCFAHRLQLQERLTTDIADAIQTHLQPRGVAVEIRATHGCMVNRGVRQPTAELVTSAMLGYMRDRPEARAEFLALSQRR